MTLDEMRESILELNVMWDAMAEVLWSRWWDAMDAMAESLLLRCPIFEELLRDPEKRDLAMAHLDVREER